MDNYKFSLEKMSNFIIFENVSVFFLTLSIVSKQTNTFKSS